MFYQPDASQKDNKKKEREKEIDVYGASAGLLVIVNSLFIPGRVPEASPHPTFC
jgi:hypothetical protein